MIHDVVLHDVLPTKTTNVALVFDGPKPEPVMVIIGLVKILCTIVGRGIVASAKPDGKPYLSASERTYLRLARVTVTLMPTI